MKTQQRILVGSGVILFLLIYFFANTTPPAKPLAATAEGAAPPPKKVDASVILAAAKQKLSANRQAYVSGLENAVVRGDVKDQQIKVYQQLAGFWKDSVHFFEPYAYYTAAAAKLENSEKSLTFAARQFLNELKGTNQPAVKQWMADEAKDLFTKALAINPANDSSVIGLGSCYIFGSSAGDPQEVMTGIQKILAVARRDSTNMYAQLMLGIGGVVSGQLDKATERLKTVVEHEPDNLEAIFMLAEAYERRNDNTNAVYWYQQGKKQVQNPRMIKELDEKIKSLK
ncbi:MAG TPA: tetratricopeptide repeat protein [Chitinophagaceae bacterium]|nr:tetratricopeptide repeat protein [Chitinophagaceae bacterium]